MPCKKGQASVVSRECWETYLIQGSTHMNRLMSWLGSSALFIGCLIGAMMVASTPHRSVASEPPATEEGYLRWLEADHGTWTDEMKEAWTSTEEANRALASTAFGPARQPGLFYRVADPIDGPGVYKGYTHDAQVFTLVIFVSTDPLTEMSNGEQFDGNGSGRYVFGEIRGPAGNVGVRGVIASTTRACGTLDQMLFVDDVMSPQQTQTWRSTGVLAIAAKEPRSTTSNEHAFMATTGQTQQAAKNCLKPELLSSALCIAAAAAAFALCHKVGTAATIAGLIKCATLLSIPFFGVAAAGICVAAVIALRLASIRACAAALSAALAYCLWEYGQDVVNCKLERLVGW